MQKNPDPGIPDDALLVFIGHSDDAHDAAAAIRSLESEVSETLGQYDQVSGGDLPFRSVRFFEHTKDAPKLTGGQGALIGPVVEKTHIAVFVFCDRVGDGTWEELKSCRHREIPVIAAFAKSPSRPIEENLDLLRAWIHRQEKRKELTSDWLESDSKAVSPVEFRNLEELKELVLKHIRKALPSIVSAKKLVPENNRKCFVNFVKSNGIAIHSFLGLNSTEPASLRVGQPFQDFIIDPSANPNAIRSLWADARGSSISAVIEGNRERRLRIDFDNVSDKCFPANVGIFPQGLVARRRRQSEERFLSFDAKKISGPPSLVVAVRVVNEYLEGWQYCKEHGEFHQFSITSRWEPHDVDLETPALWQLFPGSGNRIYGPQDRSFQIIASLVLEFGGAGSNRPGQGSGILEIRNVRFGPGPASNPRD